MSGLSRSSGLLAATAGANLCKGKSIFSGLMVITDNTNVATVTVYDNALGDTSGVVLAKLSATSTTGANSLAFCTPVCAELGISYTVAGAGTPQGLIYFGS